MNIPSDKLKYADLIRQLVPINELSDEVQNQLISKAELLTVKKKRKVFKEGAKDHYSYYLLDGEIELVAKGHVHSSIIGGTDRARYPMAQLQPRQFTGRASMDSVVLQLDRGNLDKLLVADQNKSASNNFTSSASHGIEMEVSELDSEEEEDWMTRMLSSELFSGIPTANIHQLFTLLDPVEYKAGDKIIVQGETGEMYYIVQEGRCEVLRASKPGAKELKLAEYRPGDSFGEEALITGTPRNATVRMLSDGIVAQLSKDDFVKLIQKPTVKTISAERASEIIGQGGKWLDVRSKDEHQKSTIDGSMNIPLGTLRGELKNLSADVHYVMFCDTGARSSAATFVLTDRGMTASCLEGGLMNHPKLAPLDESPEEQAPPESEAKEANESPQSEAKPEPETKEAVQDRTPGKPAAPAREQQKDSGAEPPAQKGQEPAGKETKPESKQKAPPKAAAAPPARETAKRPSRKLRDDDTMDPEILATVLDAEQTLTNMRLERIKKRDQTDIRYKKMAQDLEKEKARIEEQKKRIATEVTKLRKHEQERVKRIEQEAEARMQKERKKIEQVYSKNAEEIEKLEKMKQEAESKLKAERDRLAKELEEAKKNKEDADEIRKKFEASQRAMEEEAKKQQEKQDALRKKLEIEARKKIELEKKKLAEQFTRSNQEIEQARREKAIAEAAREAAKKEAEAMIAEFKTDFEKNKEKEQERLKLERLKLEEDQKKIQNALQDVQQARADAEAMRRAAMDEVQALKAEQQRKESDQDDAAIRELKEQIKAAQDKLADATKQAIKVEKDEEKVFVAQKENKEGIIKKQLQEDALSKQVAADLEDFESNYEVQEKKFSSTTTQMEHMRRIKERAESARRAAEQANLDLMADISSQLGKKD